MSTSAEFVAVLQELRDLLQRHAGKLSVAEDTPKRYCLDGGLHPKHRTAMPIACVQVGRAYVSFHHMGLYARPAIRSGLSKELKARMQGRACFNFKSVDYKLFTGHEDLTERGFDAFRSAGYLQ